MMGTQVRGTWVRLLEVRPETVPATRWLGTLARQSAALGWLSLGLTRGNWTRWSGVQF